MLRQIPEQLSRFESETIVLPDVGVEVSGLMSQIVSPMADLPTVRRQTIMSSRCEMDIGWSKETRDTRRILKFNRRRK